MDGQMSVLYSIDLCTHRPVVDNTASIFAFDRVGYHLELLHMEYGHQYVYVSMNPFTNDVTSLGVPDKTAFQQHVSHVTLTSNVLSLPQGHHEKGYVEFTPHAYTPMVSSDKKIDPTGDKIVHGCMQFFIGHTCVFAYNNFHAPFGVCDVGIGNAPRGCKDWSFAHNSGEYIKKTLTVFVRPFVYTGIVQEAALWRGCYALDIPMLKKRLDYNFDLYNYNAQHLPFDTVGYLLHIGTQFVWVSMDAFTSHHCELTIPGLNGLVVNKGVTNLHIISSTFGHVYKSRGHIRISPYDYTTGVSGLLGYDDAIMNYGEYGCFQIYDGAPGDADTNAVVSYNNFYGIPDIGIGSMSPVNRNWTLVGNAHMFDTRRFEIATRPCRACYVVPETHEMKLVYSVTMPDQGPAEYGINNYDASSNRPFTRVGYFLELGGAWMYVSFDWHDIHTIGIPSGPLFTFVENGHIKGSDGADIKSTSKIWVAHEHGGMRIGYKEQVFLSYGAGKAGFYGTEVPVSTFGHRNMQVFINRHDHSPDVVFLVTGQSNSQGTGGYYDPTNEDDAMNENILSWNIHDKSWDVASLERYMGTKPLLSQCFAFHFAKKYIKRFPDKKIGLVVCGAPGQSICRWSHTEYPRSTNAKKDIGDIFDKTVIYMKEAMGKSKAHHVEGILWHQGESDYNETHAYYRHRLKHVITEYRRMFHKNTLFIAGEVLKQNDTHKQNTVLRELNHNNDVLTRCAFSKNLEHCGDALHFNTQSHRDLGDMYFEQYMITQYMCILTDVSRS